MRVFIAEKPSLGEAIAAILPGPQKRHKTHIESGEVNVVVWCAGHILEQYFPEDYDPALKKWTLESLPIEPAAWQMKVSTRTQDLYQTIKRFAKDADMIIHARDPDREGQLLVDEVLTQLNVTCPVKRILINDLNPATVVRWLGELGGNTDYAGLLDDTGIDGDLAVTGTVTMAWFPVCRSMGSMRHSWHGVCTTSGLTRAGISSICPPVRWAWSHKFLSPSPQCPPGTP